MFLGPVAYLGLCCFLLTHHCTQGQANKVSSKLDFDDTESNSNQNQTGVPVIIGQGQPGQGSGGYDQGSGRAASGPGGGGGGASGSGGGGGGNRPKIHGVRVTVDTGDGQQQTKESKESVEITDVGKHKKRVGIHTDITFEITAEGDANETSSAQQPGEKEDASVPIYKGRASTNDSRHKSRNHHDPKSQWNPNFSSEHRGYDSSGRAGSRHGSGDYYPQYYPQQVYTSGSNGGSNGGTWTHYVPVWTTERSPHEQSQLQRRPSWKPCYCMSSYGTDYRRRRDSRVGVVKSHVVLIDGKLDKPFS